MLEKYSKYLLESGYSPRTEEAKRYVLRKYAGYIRDNFNKRVDKADLYEIESYFKYLMNSKKTICTKVTVINDIKSFYRWLYKKRHILYNPLEDNECLLKADKIPKHIPDEKTIKIFLSQPEEYLYRGIRDRAILELLYSTGIRHKELIKLKLSDIDMEKSLLTIRSGKFNKDRIVPVGKEALKRVERYIEKSRPRYLKRLEEEHLFITTEGEYFKKTSLGEIFQRYRKKGNLTVAITPHSLRHACAIGMLRGGAPIEMVQKMLGHKDINSTQIYTKLYPKDLKKAHAKCHPREKKNIAKISHEYIIYNKNRKSFPWRRNGKK